MNPAAFLHVDLDGIWAVRECYGLDAGTYYENDPVYSEGIDRFTELFSRKGIQGGFFVVGRDMQIDSKAKTIADLARSGHEIGNHSENHVLGLTRLSEKEIQHNISQAQDLIVNALDKYGADKNSHPKGFRSPGYDIDAKVANALTRLGFLYDSSLFPTGWGFLMRWIDAWISGRSPFSGKKSQYGGFSGFTKPLEPLLRKTRNGNLYEFPVSVSRTFRLPFHFGVSLNRGFSYFHKCAEAYRKKGIPLMYLFHGIDLVDTRGMKILPGSRGQGFFNMDIDKKLRMAEKILDYITEHFEVCRTKDWIERQGSAKKRSD